jgi:23S rRNA (guanosine2251-2'-O)-methyltransferase
MDLICGINPVLEALSAGTRHFDRLLIVKGLRNRRVADAISRASQMGVPLRFESRETLDRMAGGLPHQGIIAVVSAKPVIGLEEILATARTPPLLVLLDGVEDPRNLGAILRTVEASGTDGVLLPERHTAGLSETVSRASAGGLEHVKVARVGNVVQALEALKAKGFWIVGFDGSAPQRWDTVDYRQPITLVLGGEGRGIRRLVREHCDHLVSIPLFGHVGSLNVSVAAGIALYEAIRQRGTVPSHVRPIPVRPSAPARPTVVSAPNDGEADPGHLGGFDDAAPDQEDEEAPITTLVHIDEDEWTAPTMLRSQARVQHHGGPGNNRRRFRARGEGGRPHHAPPPPAAQPAGDQQSGDHRRRRRRRRGGAPGGAPNPPNPAAQGSSPEASPGVPAPGGGGRRRRRRRRGRPA